MVRLEHVTKIYNIQDTNACMALDSVTTGEIMKLFHALHKKGQTIVIVTHDMDIAQQCDRMIELTDGSVV